MNDFRNTCSSEGCLQSESLSNQATLSRLIASEEAHPHIVQGGCGQIRKGYEARVFAVFDRIPSQLMRKEKRFMLSSLGKNARSRTYEDAFVWLEEAMVVNPCFNAEDPCGSLEMSAIHSTLKCYLGDTGLLVSLAFWDKKYQDNDLYEAILLDKMNVNEGMLAENVVAQMLRASGHRLFFYSRADSNNRANTMEIDFLVSGGKRCLLSK